MTNLFEQLRSSVQNAEANTKLASNFGGITAEKIAALTDEIAAISQAEGVSPEEIAAAAQAVADANEGAALDEEQAALLEQAAQQAAEEGDPAVAAEGEEVPAEGEEEPVDEEEVDGKEALEAVLGFLKEAAIEEIEFSKTANTRAVLGFLKEAADEEAQVQAYFMKQAEAAENIITAAEAFSTPLEKFASIYTENKELADSVVKLSEKIAAETNTSAYRVVDDMFGRIFSAAQ